jgi:FlaG/FlaF family flagellin (archaellin)
MRRNRFRPGDDAVSTVVGVVLLVGIAVMMMTTIGIFVLGFGPGERAPESEIQLYENTDGNVTVTAVRPAGLVEEEVVVRVNGERACYRGSNEWDDTGPIPKADSVVIDGYGSSCTSIDPGDLVRVIWRAPSGDRTEIVGEYETA